jgi:transcriptional regulator with XRE-family HTH domain
MRQLDRREELSAFLRQRRAQLKPADAGLAPALGHRRTPGLRREELAALAGISAHWYMRLEQGRSERPSPSVLDALARALRLTSDERAHLYALARGEHPPLDPASGEALEPGLDRVLRLLPGHLPGYVLGRRWDVLAWNRQACDSFLDFSYLAPARRNLIELIFLEPAMRARYPDWRLAARSMLASFRASAGRHLDVPEVNQLVSHLSKTSQYFAECWDLQEVTEHSSGIQRICRDDGSHADMRFDTVLSPAAEDQRLIIYSPAPSDQPGSFPVGLRVEACSPRLALPGRPFSHRPGTGWSAHRYSSDVSPADLR